MAHSPGDARDRLVRELAPMALLIGTLAVVLRLVAQPLANPDTYFHLRFGAEFLHGTWSLGDPGTVTPAATSDWVPTQWLAQLTMAWVEERFGLAGVAWLSGLQMSALVVVVYWVGRRWAAPLAVVPLVILALVGCAPGLSMRPQVLSYVLFAVVVGALLSGQQDGRPRWLLVPLVAVWACLHGMWPVAILLSALSATGLCLDRRLEWRRLLGHAALPIGAAAAACLTPVGPAIYAGVADVLGRRDYFAEWSPPDFTSISNAVVVLMLVLTVALTSRHWSWAEGLLLLGLAGLALYSTRTVPLAAVGLVPVTASAIQTRLSVQVPVSRPERWGVTGGWFAALAMLALVVPTTSAQPPPKPSWLSESLEVLPEDTLVVNDWSWGGYLMWRYPHLAPLMHGYGDQFTDSELQRNRDIRDLEPGWDRMIEKTGARYALVDPESPLGYALSIDTNWTVVHRAQEIELLVRVDP